MMKIANFWNDLDPLKRVIVGRVDFPIIPPEEPAISEKVSIDSETRGIWSPRPTAIVEIANGQLDNYVKILEGLGIQVDRPMSLQWNQAIQTPNFRVESGFTQMPSCSTLFTTGNEIMALANSFRCRYFEYLVYWPLMNQYLEEDPEFKWVQAPRPRLTDKSYKHNYYDERISLKERLERTAAKDFVTTEVEPMRDVADVIRVDKDLFIQHDLTTNRKAMEWFKRYYPDLWVHTVNFPGDPYPIHIDATFAPLRPGLIINNPYHRLPEEQCKIFEANDWQIVDVAPPAHEVPSPLCYSSIWLSTNCLAIDHKAACVEVSEAHQIEQMGRFGMNVIPVPFRDVYAFGGGLHCVAADIYREGGCEDYFPNQVANPTPV